MSYADAPMKPRRRELAAGFVLAALGTAMWVSRGGPRTVQGTPGVEGVASQPVAGSADAELRVPIAPEGRLPEPVADPEAWLVRVERDGQGVPGATVAWMTLDDDRAEDVLRRGEDVLVRLRRIGRTVNVDEVGEARVPPFQGVLGAWDGQRTTYRGVSPRTERPIVLALEPELDVEVRVRDAAGAPVIGLPVVADLRGTRVAQAIRTTDASASRASCTSA